MEQVDANNISELFGKLTQYQNEEDSQKSPTSPSSSSKNASSITELSDGNAQRQKKQINIDEKYFHFKLQHLLGVPKKFSFSNVEIMIKDFLSDIKLYIDEEVKNNKELDIKKANDIKKEIELTMIDEKKIELDSFFFNVSGKNINKFLENICQYSFPPNNIEIFDDKDYMVLVESTHSLNSTIIKKTEQLRKYYLFFSVLDKYVNEYGKYLGSFANHFIDKYFSLTKVSLSRNYLILIVTDKTLKLFKETMNNVNEKHIHKVIKDDVKKCFPELFVKKTKIYKNEMNIDNENNIDGQIIIIQI